MYHKLLAVIIFAIFLSLLFRLNLYKLILNWLATSFANLIPSSIYTLEADALCLAKLRQIESTLLLSSFGSI